MTTRAELRARLIDAMTPGRPVPAARLRELGLDLSPDLMRRVSRASRLAASDAEAVLAADAIAESVTTSGRERAALALRLAVSGRSRPATPEHVPTPKADKAPSVTPAASSREDRVNDRLRRMHRIDGVPLEQFRQEGPHRP